MLALNRSRDQPRKKELFDQGFHKPGDVENRLGFYVGKTGR